LFILKRFLPALLGLLLPLLAPAQVMNDPASQKQVLTILDHIYNLEFVEADGLIKQIQARYPQHPVGPVLRATQIELQNLPLSDNKAATAQFAQAVEQGLQLAKRMLDKNENDPEAVFFTLTCHSYLASLYNNQGESLKAVGESKKAYDFIRDGVKLVDKNTDFYFTTGLYNYYVERYPADHPIVKPFMFFFADGNMAKGLQQMDVAAQRGLFMRTVANYYLAHIMLKYESNPARAVGYAKYLSDKFPANPLFTMNYAEVLLLSGRYTEARPYVQRLKQMPGKLAPLATSTFSGLLAEMADKKDKEAAEFYEASLRLPVNVPYTKEYQAFSYAGLARIAARANDRKKADMYYKKVLSIAQYKSLIREAKAY
jgi:tetratricopeptide (TPR) repeat protein